MKKLMIAAALAAVSLMGEAKTEPQVYDMTITLKTSWCNKKGDVIAKISGYTGALFVYRTQITRKLAGAFWGCDCDVIAAPLFWGNCKMMDITGATELTDVMPYARDGFVFWDATDKAVFWDRSARDVNGLITPWAQTFEWDILNVIGKKSANVEGYWTLAIADKVNGEDILKPKTGMIYLEGAGYGSAKIYGVERDYPIPVEFSEATFANYIKTMKGYTVGFLKLDGLTKAVGCLYCGTEVNCDAFRFCTCKYCAAELTTQAAPAFGSWTLKYNSSAVSKLKAGQSIIDADTKILKAVREDMPRLKRGYMDPLAKTAAGKASAYTGSAQAWDWTL